MDLGISGKIALVCAASRGLGRAVAAELAAEGCRVAVCARSATALCAAASEIAGDTGAVVVPIPADVADPSQVTRLVAAVRAALGPPEIVVANAGGPPTGSFAEHSPEAWDAALRANLLSAVSLARETLPDMRAAGWGRFVAITSVSARQPIPGLMLSNAARAGVHGFLKTLASETAADGVTVNMVCPGHTDTERVRALAEDASRRRGVTVEEVYAEWEHTIPAGRLGRPEELAAAVAFLCSSRASYITGTAIPVEGGAIRALP